VRVTDRPALERIAAGFEAKYGAAWHFDVGDDGFDTAGHGIAHVFRVEPAKALVFAKDPHGQTTVRF
jgi:hypothetical protein